ncbi:hypothetical protein BZA05DRAFT_96129 [Tricharina praecox]|uniref:uncharacterized protein n=1 Tax=Tricharina praecox TaxID=43433 RepID=UPI00221FC42E|nr:uncharacterized protein BZA05DRAFT_96129 [Tricharina praecox]KAI5848379.1 hypothetical protein BZA05DRAFT_96129 [Tricharina praecox]
MDPIPLLCSPLLASPARLDSNSARLSMTLLLTIYTVYTPILSTHSLPIWYPLLTYSRYKTDRQTDSAGAGGGFESSIFNHQTRKQKHETRGTKYQSKMHTKTPKKKTALFLFLFFLFFFLVLRV